MHKRVVIHNRPWLQKVANTIYIRMLQFVGAISHEICNESRLNDVNIFSQLNEVTVFPSNMDLTVKQTNLWEHWDDFTKHMSILILAVHESNKYTYEFFKIGINGPRF